MKEKIQMFKKRGSFMGVSDTLLAEIENKADGFAEVAKKILSNLFEKLEESSIPYQFVGLEIEQDTEIADWRYVIVRIKLDVNETDFQKLSDTLLTYAYSKVAPKESLRVLVVFENV